MNSFSKALNKMGEFKAEPNKEKDDKLPEHLQRSLDSLDKFLKEVPKEELDALIAKHCPPDNTPKGWVSIEEALPMVTCDDFLNNDAMVKIIKVKDKNGEEFESQVGDHHIWYYRAKDAGITHWWND